MKQIDLANYHVTKARLEKTISAHGGGNLARNAADLLISIDHGLAEKIEAQIGDSTDVLRRLNNMLKEELVMIDNTQTALGA